MVLVAARRNPTVRLRYLAARDVLAAQGLDGLLPVRRDGAAAFRAAVDDLLGLRDFEGLRDRARAVRGLLPELRWAAASISTSPGGTR